MATKEELAAVAVGDTVKVIHGDRRWRDAKVVKIGRALVHIEEYGTVEMYRRDTRQRRDGYPGHFLTLAQFNDMNRRTEAIAALRAEHLEIRTGMGLSWSTDQLVALVGMAQYLKRMDPDELARPVGTYDVADIAEPRDIDLYCGDCWMGDCRMHAVPMNTKVRQLLKDYAWLAIRFESLQRGVPLQD